jgi:hypothetical protein
VGFPSGPRLPFVDAAVEKEDSDEGLANEAKRQLTRGRTNPAGFKPSQLRSIAGRIRHRTTGYRSMAWQDGREQPVAN